MDEDGGLKCVEVAKRALETGDFEKAVRFAEKAQRLLGSDHPTARALLQNAQRAASGASADASTSGARAPNGMGSGEGLRQRGAQPSAQRPSQSRRQQPTEDAAPDNDHKATPEQRTLVASIRSETCFYKILSIPRTASDDEIKRAYRKMALKLHPDKCPARGADEAFKKVSRAFTCLSDPAKRRNYDAFGSDGESMTGRGGFGGAGFRPGGGFRPTGGVNGFGGLFDEDIDPEEIFRMFFGGNPFMNTGTTRVYTYGGGTAAQRRQQQQRRAQQQATSSAAETSTLRALASLLPFIVLILVNLLSSSSQPVSSLSQTRHYPVPLSTTAHGVPFFVASARDFAAKYPLGSRERTRLEMKIENEWRDAMQRACYNERLTKQRYEYYGQKRRAEAVSLASCDELARRFASRGSNTATADQASKSADSTLDSSAEGVAAGAA